MQHPHSLPSAGDSAAFNRLSSFIASPAFPCVGAKSALNRQRMRHSEYEALGAPRDAIRLCDALESFANEFPEAGPAPVSFVAMFRRPVADEKTFEGLLWQHLQCMHEHDRTRFGWDSNVGHDPSRDDFSFSIAGRAFFVVGLHPGASRLARRAPFPCLVFNFHDQFESLKAIDKYAPMQSAIRKRDMALQGSVNPVLARFGEASEARQYSGRRVENDWQCPFHAQGAANG